MICSLFDKIENVLTFADMATTDSVVSANMI